MNNYSRHPPGSTQGHAPGMASGLPFGVYAHRITETHLMSCVSLFACESERYTPADSEILEEILVGSCEYARRPHLYKAKHVVTLAAEQCLNT